MTKQKYLLTIALGLLLLGTTGCDDKLETFETVGVTTAPTAIPASSISSEALPGQIKLTWTAPAEDAFEYMQIRYNDPLAKEDVCLIVSPGTTEMLIDETRARFGDYTFYFQTFNVNGEGSAVTEIKAQSGAAPATYREISRTKIEISADQVSVDQPDESEGTNVGNIVDGNTGTFYSSTWHGSGTAFPSYIQFDLTEPIQDFAIRYVNRADDNWRTSGRPSVVNMDVSSDGNTWTTVATINGLPSEHGSSYTSEYFRASEPFAYYRFSVTSNTGDSYFCISELELYEVEVEIYDPETVPLD